MVQDSDEIAEKERKRLEEEQAKIAAKAEEDARKAEAKAKEMARKAEEDRAKIAAKAEEDARKAETKAQERARKAEEEAKKNATKADEAARKFIEKADAVVLKANEALARAANARKIAEHAKKSEESVSKADEANAAALEAETRVDEALRKAKEATKSAEDTFKMELAARKIEEARNTEEAVKRAVEAADKADAASKKAEDLAIKAEAIRKADEFRSYENRFKVFSNARIKREDKWADAGWYAREYWEQDKFGQRQSDLLKKQIEYIIKKSPVIAEKLQSADIVNVKSIKDQRDVVRLPFSSNDMISKDQKANPPFGKLCCADPVDIVNIRPSHEGTDTPRLFLTSKYETADLYQAARALVAAGISNEDIVVSLYDDNTFWALRLWNEVLRCDYGCAVIPIALLDHKKKMEVIKQVGATVLIGTPSQMQDAAEAAKEMGLDPASSSIRILLTSGEPGIATAPKVGKKIEELWGAKNFECYGCQDIGIFAWSCDVQ